MPFPSLRRQAVRTASLAGLIALAIGLAGLLGWATGLTRLTHYLPGLPPMTVATALFAVLSGLALWRMAQPRQRQRPLTRLLAAAVACLALLYLAMDLPGLGEPLEVGLHRLLADAPPDIHPTPQTAVGFLLLAVALLLDRRGGHWPSQGLALAALSIALIGLAGQLYAAQSFYVYDPVRQRGLSLPGALALLALSLGLFSLHPGRGFLALLSSPGPGGLALRRLLPLALGVPLALMLFMQQGILAGWFGLATGSAVVGLLAALICSGLLLWLALEQDRRYRLEQSWRADEERFRTLFDNIADAIFIHSPDGRFVEVNRVACARLGYSAEELLARSPRDIDSPEFAALVPQRLDELLREGQIVFDSEHLTRDGRRLPVEINARLIRFRNRPAVISVARDIRRRLELEEARRRAEADTRALLEALDESALLVDREGRILAMNETAARRFGRQPAEMVGHIVFDFMPPDVAARRRGQLAKVLWNRRPSRFLDERQGRQFENSVNPILDAQGKVTRLATYATDVTERQQLRALDGLFHDIDRRILQGMPLAELLEFVCAELVRQFALGYVWIGRKLPGGGLQMMTGAGPEPAMRTDLDKIDTRWDLALEDGDPLGTAIRSGQPQTYRAGDPGFHRWRASAAGLGMQAVQCLPLLVRGEVYGVLALYGKHPDSFQAEGMVGRLAMLADRVCVALESALDQEQLRLRGTALATAGNAVFITDGKGDIEWVNEAFLRMTGYSAEEVIGQNPRLLKSGQQPAAFYRQLWETLRAGVTW